MHKHKSPLRRIKRVDFFLLIAVNPSISTLRRRLKSRVEGDNAMRESFFFCCIKGQYEMTLIFFACISGILLRNLRSFSLQWSRSEIKGHFSHSWWRKNYLHLKGNSQELPNYCNNCATQFIAFTSKSYIMIKTFENLIFYVTVVARNLLIYYWQTATIPIKLRRLKQFIFDCVINFFWIKSFSSSFFSIVVDWQKKFLHI